MARDDELTGNPEVNETNENIGILSDPQDSSESMGQDANERPQASSDSGNASATGLPSKIEFILDIPLEITAELARTKMVIEDMLKLRQGSIIEFSKLAGETLEILANKKLIARGEVVVVNEKYGIRLTEIVSPSERIESLK
jgi:flagellar motor switch protein FliN/FliY